MNEYFTRRAMPQGASYEKEYWGVVVDPDGNVRDRRLECVRYLEDIQEEMDFINALPPGRLLDVGCGLGFLLSGLKAGWDRHGVEVSAFAAEHARAHGHIHLGPIEEAGYADEHFDVVVIHHVIEHLEDPIGMLKELRRVLKPDGWLILGTPDFDSGAARRFGEKYRLLHDVTHISLFSNDSMHRFVRDHGFRIEHVGYPYFETRHFNRESLLSLFDTDQISPPFYGNFMTFYCRKEPATELFDCMAHLNRQLREQSASFAALRTAMLTALHCSAEPRASVELVTHGVPQSSLEALLAVLNQRGHTAVAGSLASAQQHGVRLILDYQHNHSTNAGKLGVSVQRFESEAFSVEFPADDVFMVFLVQALVQALAAHLHSDDRVRS